MVLDFPWQGTVRQYLIARDWNVSNRTRTRWIERLDCAPNALVRLNRTEKSVELKMFSSVDGILYCAGLYIQVDDFEDLYNLINVD